MDDNFWEKKPSSACPRHLRFCALNLKLHRLALCAPSFSYLSWSRTNSGFIRALPTPGDHWFQSHLTAGKKARSELTSSADFSPPISHVKGDILVTLKLVISLYVSFHWTFRLSAAPGFYQDQALADFVQFI